MRFFPSIAKRRDNKNALLELRYYNHCSIYAMHIRSYHNFCLIYSQISKPILIHCGRFYTNKKIIIYRITFAKRFTNTGSYCQIIWLNQKWNWKMNVFFLGKDMLYGHFITHLVIQETFRETCNSLENVYNWLVAFEMAWLTL